MNKHTKQLAFTSSLLGLATALLVLISAFLPAVSHAQSRSDLGQPNPRANLDRGGGTYTRYSGSSSGYRPVASGLAASCAASHFNPARGQAVTWFSSATGGDGSYTYAWSGTDGLSGNTNTVTKAYGTNGDKFATLSVTSGGQMVTVSCASIMVGAGGGQSVTSPGFGASCYSLPESALPGESVTWLSIVSGVTASTTYAWDGTDGLSGDRPMISKTYTSNGVKAAMLTVTNGSSRIVAACVNGVRIGPARIVSGTTGPSQTTISTGAPTKIQGTCTPSTTKATTNEEVVWSVAAIGGNGSFQYLWRGHESLMGTLASTTKTYKKEGVKKAEVTIVSGNKSEVVLCSTAVEIVKGWNGLTAASLFSWINGFWGFLLILPIAILIGIVVARRKRAKEEEAEEKDHVH